MKHTYNNPFTFALRISKKQWKLMLASVGCIILATLSSSILPYVMKKIVDIIAYTAEETRDLENLWWFITAYLGLYLFSFLFLWIKEVINTDVRAKMGHDMRTTLHKHITKHSNAYFSKHYSGALANKINTADSSVHIVFQVGNAFLPIGIKLTTTLVLAAITNIGLALIMAGWILVFLPINIQLLKRIKALSQNHAATKSSFTGEVVDVISNINLVKIFSKEQQELKRIVQKSNERKETGIALYSYKATITLINNILKFILIAVIFFTSIMFWKKGLITVGDIVMFLALGEALQSSIAHITATIDSFFDQYGQLEEGLSTLLKPHDIVDKKYAKPLKVPHGDIHFSDIYFLYNTQPIFSHLHLHIPAKQKIGIVGRSGAGKTTLIKLLLRLYELEDGEIIIDKQNIARITQKSLRANISTVSQESQLFNRSIFDNISYGLSVTKKEVEAASITAHAHEFITQMPQQYSTRVGERGVMLSGGQKQRITIARAILKNSPILVLDEATSALDSESEVFIQDALKKLMKDKTVIAVAHRLSTLLAMDRIIVLDKGKIIEDGNHKTLLKKKGVYAAMWKKQSGGYLKE